MAVPIIKSWKNYFNNPDEGLGSSYERVVTNIKLLKICKHFKVKNVLEVPSFGFTGVSGINSMDLAKHSCNVTVLDNDKERVEMIKNVWKENAVSADIRYTNDFHTLDFKDNSFDLSWNFASLWHVKDLNKFFGELTRVTFKVIAIFVPNVKGLGYYFLKSTAGEEFHKLITEKNIFPENIKMEMENNGWNLWMEEYIDCPPWPDIGMPKEKFLKMFGISVKDSKMPKEPLTILDYYSGKDPDFYNKMLKFDFLEKNMPKIFRQYWSHHKWMFFLPKSENEK